MSVTSKPLNNPPARTAPAGAGCLASVGIFMLLVSVGPLIILLNGGYSILGMAWIADQIGPYGRLFWSVTSFFTINVPIAEQAGLPLAQPVLPWIMVVGITALEVALILYKIKRANAGFWINAGGVAVSIFDYATTAAGLVFAPFAANLGALWSVWAFFALLLAAPLTFSFEGLLARMLKGR
jgi:hypothetical protein